jgi:hypothetical protein
MRIGRVVIIPAILILGAAGAVLSAPEISAAVTHAPAVHVQAPAASGNPNTLYRN